jgi:hypothetical protein
LVCAHCFLSANSSVFGGQAVPARVKVATATALVIIVYPSLAAQLPEDGNALPFGPVGFIAMLAKEALSVLLWGTWLHQSLKQFKLLEELWICSGVRRWPKCLRRKCNRACPSSDNLNCSSGLLFSWQSAHIIIFKIFA